MDGAKIFLTTVLTLLTLTLIVAVIPTERDGAIYSDTLRLHILANSDSDEDQRLKIKVRDEVLKAFSSELDDLKSKDDAEEKISLLLKNIESFSQEIVHCEGYSYDVSVTLTEEWYDTREYEDFTLPSGIYTSLRIIIGDGIGRNWWCVMFPPLCLDAATDKVNTGYTNEETVLISKKYNVKFKILELVTSMGK